MAPKVTATQDAVLSNYEVLQHVKELKQRYQDTGRARKVPKNLTSVLDRVQAYLEGPGAPLEPESAIHPVWSDRTIARLTKHLKPFGLLKGEILMILNLRPATRSQLEPILEESGTRFVPEQLDEIISIVFDQPTADGEYDGEEDLEEEEEEEVTEKQGADGQSLSTTAAGATNTSKSAQLIASVPITSDKMTPEELIRTMNAILKGKATHTAIDDDTREKLINQWESIKAQFDQEPLETWDANMSGLMTKLYGHWNLDPRLPPYEEMEGREENNDEMDDGTGGIMSGGVDLEDVIGREMMMASQVDKAYDWMLEPPADRVPRVVKKE